MVFECYYIYQTHSVTHNMKTYIHILLFECDRAYCRNRIYIKAYDIGTTIYKHIQIYTAGHVRASTICDINGC